MQPPSDDSRDSGLASDGRDVDATSVRDRCRRIARLRRMIQLIVCDGEPLSLAHDYPGPSTNDPGEQASFVSGIRDALRALPLDPLVRWQFVNRRVMGALYALVHNAIIAADPAIDFDDRQISRIADGIFAFLAPLTSPHATRELLQRKRRHLRALCAAARTLRRELQTASRPGVAFTFSGPREGETYILHARRVRVSSYEGLDAVPAEAGPDEQIAYVEFGGLVRMVAGRPGG